MDHALLSTHLGVLADASGVSKVVGSCGDAIEVFIKVDAGCISGLKVMPHGCAYTQACASAMSDLAMGKPLDDAAQMDPGLIIERLAGLPEDHHHCARLAVNALCAAIEDYYHKTNANSG